MTNGAKVLTAKAYDMFNNVATSAPVNVTFANVLTTQAWDAAGSSADSPHATVTH